MKRCGARGLLACLMTGLLLVTGCASTGTPVARDPLESVNRVVFSVNDQIDAMVLKPVAKTYVAVVPEVARLIVSSMLANVADVWTAANQLLQGKPAAAANDLLRFAFNSTLGLAGMADVASAMGLEKHREDFGQTLGVWGVPSGPYLVLPLLGPSSVRDGTGFAFDWLGDPTRQVMSTGERNNLALSRLIDTRAALLPAEAMIGGAALDKYSFFRDGYLQRRRSQVYDGDPPPSKDD